MRVPNATVLRVRAMFGAGFMVLGAVTLWRVMTAPGAASAKVIGGLLAVALIGLGLARMLQFRAARLARRRKAPRTP